MGTFEIELTIFYIMIWLWAYGRQTVESDILSENPLSHNLMYYLAWAQIGLVIEGLWSVSIIGESMLLGVEFEVLKFYIPE